MGLIQRLIDARGKKDIAVVQETQGQILHNALCSNAENVFAQARPLINELKMVRPYGIGRNGARLPLTKTPELSKLETPNEEMGWAEFADLMLSTWLTEKELNVHVWKDARGNIAGYTVLPVNARYQIGGEDRFRTTLPSGETVELTRNEVMTLRFARNPRNIDAGISPGVVSMIWAQIDDVMAQYQLGHFENGAVPAYVTIIRASTREKYLEKRDEMERGFHGARNKGKTLFLWRQFLDDGAERDEVEVKTIQGSNASLAIKDIMAIVNDKLNKAFGVSEFILGNDSSAKYDNAELSQQQFMSHRVYPALYTFWSQFQHELDRIVGGLGYAVGFDLEIPELTDRMKVKAETRKIDIETTKTKTETELAIKRFEAEREKLKAETRKIEAEAYRIELENQKLEAELAQPTTAADITEAEVVADAYQATCDCGHCGKRANDAYAPQFSPDEIIERAIYDELLGLYEALINDELGEQLGLSEEEINALIDRVAEKLMAVSEKGIDQATAETKKSIEGLPTAVVVGVINGQRPTSRAELIEAIEKSAAPTKNGETTSERDIDKIVREKMSARTDELVKKYSAEAKETIRKALETSSAKTKAEIKKELMESLPKSRAEMIARNEVVQAFRIGQLEQAKAFSERFGLKITKTWLAHSGGCPICAAMNGKTVDLYESFPAESVDKDGVTYAWEHSKWNEDGETPNAHVNCRCTFTTETVA